MGFGVNKSTSNNASRAELGRYPLYCDVVKLTQRFAKRINDLPDTRIAKQAYELQKNCKASNWSSATRTLLEIWQLTDNTGNTPQTLHSYPDIDKEISKKIEKIFWEELHTDKFSKLRTYKTLKKSYNSETYLQLNIPSNYKIAITKLRTSDHTLQIERGRHTTPKTPLEERLCLHCKNAVEDEKHYLIYCGKYQNERKKMLDSLSGLIGLSDTDDDDKMLQYMLNPQCRASTIAVGKFIMSTMSK